MKEFSQHPHPLPKVSVFLASSLDGFIARSDGSLDWLDQANTHVPQGEDFGFREFFASTDVLVLGRKSFEKVLQFSEWPYGERKVVVMSSQSSILTLPIALQPTVSVSDEKPLALLERLANEGFQHVYLDGGQVVQSFIREQLVDELTLTLIPVLLGSGLRFLGDLHSDVNLKLLRSRAFEFGYVQLTYALLPRSDSTRTLSPAGDG